MKKFTLSIFLLALLALASPMNARAEAPVIQPRIIAEYPHDIGTSTQGLFFHEGLLYESSGGYHDSFLAIVQPDTGKHILTQPIPGRYFVEGIAPVDSSIYVLTWQSGVGFIHDRETLAPLARFEHNKDTHAEGWGLATDGARLIRSSGSSHISFHDSEDFSLLSTVQVKDGEKPIRMLNELEFIEGLLFANIWKSDKIAVINPQDGQVLAWIDLTALRERVAPECGTANGIAYDSVTGRIFVTGKHWDTLFVIEVDEVFPQK